MTTFHLDNINERDKRIYNLRREFARQIWLARRGTININEALENIQDLIVLCPEDCLESANELSHKIKNQLTKKLGKILMKKKGIDLDIRVPGIKTRDYLKTVKLPKNMIG